MKHGHRREVPEKHSGSELQRGGKKSNERHRNEVLGEMGRDRNKEG